MLLRQTPEGVIAITQPAHAWVAGLLARAWGNARFATPAPHEIFCTASALHDIGWLDWEAAPRFDAATGWPQIFADVPAEEHTNFWRKGIEHAAAYSPYVGLMVSMHGDTIYERTFDPAHARPEAAAAVQQFRAEQQRYQAMTRERLQQDPRWRALVFDEQLRFNKRLLAAVDTLSLNLCWGVTRPTTVPDVPLSFADTVDLKLAPGEDGEIFLDPWPFGGSDLFVPIEGRPLHGPFKDAETCATALASSIPVTLSTRLCPPGTTPMDLTR
jgi:hypothetical protein